MSNFLMMLATDGYKLGHGPMYRKGTTRVGSNLTPRTDKIYARNATAFYDGKLVWVGGQGAVQELHENWERTFFSQPQGKVMDEYAEFLQGYLGRDLPTVDQMCDLHELGYLPLEFRSLPEGSLVPMGIPVLTITNTLDDFFWLVNYHETPLSTSTWKTATNATIAREYSKICEHYLKITGCYDAFTLSVMCHDFSMRGMSGIEDAARSGIGHLTQFVGTDTLPAITYARGYYDATGMIGISVPATEHAVTSNNILSILAEMEAGEYEYLSNEQEDIALKMHKAGEEPRLIAEVMFVYDLITRIVPNGIVSNVSDTYDFWGMLTRGYPYLKEVIMRRDPLGLQPGKVVVRPDSGDPVLVICGDKSAPVDSPEYKGAIQILWETFGGTITETGHKLLDSHIGLIYGDSITTKRAEEILRRLAEQGYAAANVVFGVGSFTYQCNTRDTFGFAVKATNSVINGQDVAIYKDPKTDSKKKSAKGRLHVLKSTVSNDLFLMDNCSAEYEAREGNLLQVIYRDGKWIKRVSLNEIRERLA